jgi:hypothetical protein
MEMLYKTYFTNIPHLKYFVTLKRKRVIVCTCIVVYLTSERHDYSGPVNYGSFVIADLRKLGQDWR